MLMDSCLLTQKHDNEHDNNNADDVVVCGNEGMISILPLPTTTPKVPLVHVGLMVVVDRREEGHGHCPDPLRYLGSPGVYGETPGDPGYLRGTLYLRGPLRYP